MYLGKNLFCCVINLPTFKNLVHFYTKITFFGIFVNFNLQRCQCAGAVYMSIVHITFAFICLRVHLNAKTFLLLK